MTRANACSHFHLYMNPNMKKKRIIQKTVEPLHKQRLCKKNIHENLMTKDFEAVFYINCNVKKVFLKR